MITESFDTRTEALIDPSIKEDAVKVDACIITFSHEIEKYVCERFNCEQIATFYAATGKTPVWRFTYGGKTFAFFKNYIGAPAYVALLEDSRVELNCDKYILFGGAGCLNKEIARGKVMVPTAAYRDEGTSYHYAPPSDFIDAENAPVVEAFMQEAGLPYAMGKTWTTDAFYRETKAEVERHKAEGCISVEMEFAGAQAWAKFRGKQLYGFFTSGDLLDAPKWDYRKPKDGVSGTQHDVGHFDIALELAHYVASLED